MRADEKRTRRCNGCEVNWPNLNDEGVMAGEFARCPRCEGFTHAVDRQPDFASFADAVSEKRRIKFEQYIERREAGDRELIAKVEPAEFAQYLMDAAEEQSAREEA